MANKNYSLLQKTFAWAVHLFTASGLVAGFMAILAINEKDWRAAMFWLIICLVIDGVDGTFARLAKVKKVLPDIDGKTIDYVIDFATYAIIPAYFFYAADLVDASWNLPLTALILLISALYYGKEGMVSADHYFIGFPVLWNMVVFYLIFVFGAGESVNTILVIIFAILHFVPIKFAYPSRGTRFMIPTLIVTVLFFVMLVLTVWYFPVKIAWLTGLGWFCGLYFGVLAVYNTWLE